jgi:hypothetical protein
MDCHKDADVAAATAVFTVLWYVSCITQILAELQATLSQLSAGHDEPLAGDSRSQSFVAGQAGLAWSSKVLPSADTWDFKVRNKPETTTPSITGWLL